MLAKNSIKVLVAAVAVLCCTAAGLSLRKPVAAYNPEQTRNDIRVVLLKVDLATVFTDVGFSESTKGQIHALPGVGVTYLVELLGTEPVKTWNTFSDGSMVSVDGAPLKEPLPDNVVGGGHSSSHEYRHYNWRMMKQPAVTDPKRVHIEETWQRGLRISAGRVDLKIKAGFNGKVEEFVFKNVPVE